LIQQQIFKIDTPRQTVGYLRKTGLREMTLKRPNNTGDSMRNAFEIMKNTVKNNQGSIVQLIPDILVFGINVLTKKYEGGYKDLDGSIDHYDRYANHTLREAPPGSRKFDIVIPGPNAGKKFKLRK
jgi:hypothetical protein